MGKPEHKERLVSAEKKIDEYFTSIGITEWYKKISPYKYGAYLVDPESDEYYVYCSAKCAADVGHEFEYIGKGFSKLIERVKQDMWLD